MLQCVAAVVVWPCLHELWMAGGCRHDSAAVLVRTAMLCSDSLYKAAPAWQALLLHVYCTATTLQTTLPMASPAAAARHTSCALSCPACSAPPQVVRHQPP